MDHASAVVRVSGAKRLIPDVLARRAM